MKKVFSLMLLLATMLTFTACSSDDEPEVSYPSIVGTWTRTVSQQQIGDGTMTVTQTQIFRKDKTATGLAEMYLNDKLYQSKSFEYTYVYDGKTLKMTGKDSGETKVFNVSISDNRLTMSGSGGTFVLTKI